MKINDKPMTTVMQTIKHPSKINLKRHQSIDNHVKPMNTSFLFCNRPSSGTSGYLLCQQARAQLAAAAVLSMPSSDAN
jgi:hypothetical protein